MAEDHNARYRTSESLGRASLADNTNDPLAELARLIGKRDPFSDLTRNSASAPRDHSAEDPGAAYPGSTYAPASEAPQYSGDVAPPYSSDPAPHYGNDPGARYGGEHTPRYGNEQEPRRDLPGQFDSPRSSYAADPFVLPSLQSWIPPAPSHANQAYSDPHGQRATESHHSDHSVSEASAEPFLPSDRPA